MFTHTPKIYMTPSYTKKIITLKENTYKPKTFPITPIHI